MAAWDSHTPKMNFGVKLQSGFGASGRPSPPPGFKKMVEVAEVLDAQSAGEIAYIVGTKGANIIEIRNETKTSIITSKKGDLKNRFTIIGPEEGVRRAKQMIQQQLDFFRKKEQERMKRETEVTARKEVPLKLVGAIIGTKGETVRSIQESTNTRIKSPSMGDLPIFEITGQQADVEAAQDRISEICDVYSTNWTFTDSDVAADNWGSTKSEPWHVDQHKAFVAATSHKLSSTSFTDASDAQDVRTAALQKQLNEKKMENEQLKKSVEQMRSFIKENGLNEAFIEFILTPRASNP